MRRVVSDEVENGLGGVGFADLLRSPHSAEGARLSVHHHRHLRAELCVGASRLAVRGERLLPLLTDLLKPTDRVLLNDK